MRVTIRQAKDIDLDDLVSMSMQLWDDEDEDELADVLAELLESPREVAFVAVVDGVTVGFATASIRHDYVEGSSSSPVGYLEGIFVEPEMQRQGIARALVIAVERWVAAAGCNEFGSDTDIDNAESQAFHEALGFEEVGRLVSFLKDVDVPPAFEASDEAHAEAEEAEDDGDDEGDEDEDLDEG